LVHRTLRSLTLHSIDRAVDRDIDIGQKIELHTGVTIFDGEAIGRKFRIFTARYSGSPAIGTAIVALT
jgi:hypothetical protein